MSEQVEKPCCWAFVEFVESWYLFTKINKFFDMIFISFLDRFFKTFECQFGNHWKLIFRNISINYQLIIFQICFRKDQSTFIDNRTWRQQSLLVLFKTKNHIGILLSFSENHFFILLHYVVFLEAVNSIDCWILEFRMLILAYFSLQMRIRMLRHLMQKCTLLQHLFYDLIFNLLLLP